MTNRQDLRSRRRFSIAALCAPVVISGCASAVAPDNPNDIAAWMDLFDVPGAAVAVINDFEVDYVEYHGVHGRTDSRPVTESTLFQAASLSKSVTAMGVLHLAQNGVVSLDRDVNEYLTSWHVPDNSRQATEKVTLRRLLSHTAGTTVSGFRGYRVGEAVPSLLQILDGAPPANSEPIIVGWVPGSRFEYSGGGFLIAQQVVEDVTGEPFPTFIRKTVLDPIGLSSSTFEQPLPEALRPAATSGNYRNGTAVPGGHHTYPEIAAGGWWATAGDVARFLIEIQKSRRGESNAVLSRENADLLVTEVRNDYALGIALRTDHGQRFMWHAGANDGFRGAMLAHLTGGYGVVVLTNSDYGHPELAEAVFELIGEREGWPGF